MSYLAWGAGHLCSLPPSSSRAGFSGRGLRTSSGSSTWERVSNAGVQAPSQTYRVGAGRGSQQSTLKRENLASDQAPKRPSIPYVD